MATRRTLSIAAAAALVLGACTDRCPMEAGFVDPASVEQYEGTCRAQLSVPLTVRLCEDCRFSSPNCEADVTALPQGGTPGEVFLATQWEKCDEDEGCPWATGEEACFTPACVVTVPSPGPWTINYLAGTDSQGNPITGFIDVQLGIPACT